MLHLLHFLQTITKIFAAIITVFSLLPLFYRDSCCP